jgi:isopentenyl diphosphate isomerase/L-lactate dehydrogenase-like FMN-dependent dehydrogenase
LVKARTLSGLARVVNVADVRRAAERRLPRVVFDYVDGGAEGEVTLRENERAFQDVTFRPRYAAGVERCELGVNVLGSRLSMPLFLAPCGFSRLVHPHGELAAARAAGKLGVGFALSTMSSYGLEDVARVHASGPLWYQLYLIGGRAAAENVIERARAARYTALVLTIDTAVAGMRERDVRNGAAALLGRNKLAMIPYLPHLLARPPWLLAYLLDGGPAAFPNILASGKGPMLLCEARAALRQCSVTWKDLSWIREMWSGPIVIKGVLTGDDARRALDEGAAALIVSNHGGRQLDGVRAALRALPEVVEAASGRVQVLMDGGIRRGSDVLKAICLGASAVLVGRAYMYGLGAAGEKGVLRVLDILRDDLLRTMTLLGCSSITELNRSLVDPCSN